MSEESPLSPSDMLPSPKGADEQVQSPESGVDPARVAASADLHTVEDDDKAQEEEKDDDGDDGDENDAEKKKKKTQEEEEEEEARAERAAAASPDPPHENEVRAHRANWLEEQRRRTRAEQAARREYIAGEQHLVATATMREEAHWQKQDVRFKKMVVRARNSTKTCEELLAFVTGGQTVMRQFAEGMHKLDTWGTTETGTLRQAAIAHDLLRESILEHFSEMQERVFADAIEQAAALKTQQQKKAAALEKNGQKATDLVRKNRKSIIDAWAAYEKDVDERQKAELADKPVERDPLLACRTYDKEVAEARRVEGVYSKEMTRLFLELKMDDGRRIDGIKSVALDYLLGQKALLEHVVKFIDSAITSVKAIDREKDVMDFVRHADLLLTDKNRTPPPPPPQSSSGAAAAAAAGDEKKGGGGGGGGDSAQQAKKDEAAATAKKKKKKVPPPPPPTATVFEARPPDRDRSMLKRLYSQELEREGKLFRQGKWVKSRWKEVTAVISKSGFLHYFENPKDSQPAFSLRLASCRCNIAPDIDEDCFELVHPNKGFFGWGSSDVRHLFKASTQAQMVDWMISLQKFADRQYKDEHI